VVWGRSSLDFGAVGPADMAEVNKVIEAIQAAKVALSGTPHPDLDVYKYATEIQKNAEFRYAPEERTD